MTDLDVIDLRFRLPLDPFPRDGDKALGGSFPAPRRLGRQTQGSDQT